MLPVVLGGMALHFITVLVFQVVLDRLQVAQAALLPLAVQELSH
jgi:hypothetical protein